MYTKDRSSSIQNQRVAPPESDGLHCYPCKDLDHQHQRPFDAKRTLITLRVYSVIAHDDVVVVAELAYFMGIKQSKILKKPKHEMISINPRQTTAEYVYSSPHRKRSMAAASVALHKAALKGDWDSAEGLLTKNDGLKTSPITDGGEIALHIAAIEGHEIFVSKLLGIMEVAEVEVLNTKGCTALCFAAAAGHTHIARIMVKMNSRLPTIKGDDGVWPLHMAAMQGFHEMAQFLYPLSDFQSWTSKDKINLLTTSIDSELYGLATKIVNEHNTLAIEEDVIGETPLQVLARKPLAFCSNNGQGLWVKIIRTVLPYMKSRTHDDMSGRGDAYTLLDCLWNAAEICEEDIEAERTQNNLKLFFIAAESGNDGFLVELLRRDPNFLYKVNESKHSIFHVAVLHRYAKVFSLMYELGGIKSLTTLYIDIDGNNILHLAAKLAPPNQLNTIPVAALQMQHEVLWYKEVEKLVLPAYRNMKNNAGERPHELFLKEHEPLRKEGEKSMKQTAKACMLVAMLIATVVFTTAFTVPGGYNNSTGVPILEKSKLFMIFPVSEAVATLSSLTSMLMFLSILTSRYSDDDFLKTLPFWLVVGVAALFFSIVAMMVAFCSCLLFFEHGWASATLLLVFFGSVPTMFVVLKYPLLTTILRCTYGCPGLFRSYHRLHS
ncbi:hypothetical protein C2S51_016075 [Perilla frutescens var. frutescens]|nr:hypothetical protein C2S51_016075 [Perilla frutescens var. frutescens]